MNRKQFIILLGLVVILGFAGLRIYNKQNGPSAGSNPAKGEKLLGDFQINDVARVDLDEGTNRLSLVKKDDLWRVSERHDYPANFSEISGFLLKASDQKIIQSEQAGPAELARLNLVPGQGTNAALSVDLKDSNGKTLKSLVFGKQHYRKEKAESGLGGDMDSQGWPDGRYVRLGGNSDQVALISEAFANIVPRPDQWLNKDFFKAEKIRAVAVTYPDTTTNSFKVSRESESGEWKLADAKPGEALDASKLSGLASCSPTFSDVAGESGAQQPGLAKPALVTLDTFDHFTYNLKVGQKTNDNYPVIVSVTAQLPKERTPGKDEKPDQKAKLDEAFKAQQKQLEDKLAQERKYEKWVYLVSAWTLEPVLRERSQILQEKKEEPKKEDKTAPASATSASTSSPLGGGSLIPPAPLSAPGPKK